MIRHVRSGGLGECWGLMQLENFLVKTATRMM